MLRKRVDVLRCSPFDLLSARHLHSRFMLRENDHHPIFCPSPLRPIADMRLTFCGDVQSSAVLTDRGHDKGFNDDSPCDLPHATATSTTGDDGIPD